MCMRNTICRRPRSVLQLLKCNIPLSLAGQPARYTGLTLVEVLVSVSVISVLIGLLIPAVQRIREAAARTQCSNNLKQIGIAFQLFHDANGVFPTNGGFVSGVAHPHIATVRAGKPSWWPVGDPTLSARTQSGSWAFAILPYVEQQDAFRGRTFGVAVPGFMCPTRHRDNPQHVPFGDPVFDFYTYISDGINPWGKTDYAANSRVISAKIGHGFRYGTALGILNITDGTSNTLLIGEKAMDPRLYNTGGWLWDEPILAGGGAGGTVRSGTDVVFDTIGRRYDNRWGSAHSAGALFLWVDGSVRLIPHGTLRGVIFPLLTPAGGEINQEF